MLALIAPLLLAAAAPSDTERLEIETTVVGIFRSYTGPPGSTAAWDQAIYSAEVTALIAQWKAVMPEGELDGLNDGDWLCQCQDWDGDAFQARINSIQLTAPAVAEVAITVDLGFGQAGSEREERLILRREGEAWMIDDIVAESFPNGLRQALRETIAADEALRAGNGG
jgi:hypothetical protein